MLTILGGGGWFPAFGRATACSLLREGDAAILIDADTGVGRLMERSELLAGVHSSAAQAAQVAIDAAVEDLLLIHLPPFEPTNCGLLNEARRHLPSARIADELTGPPALA